MPGSIKLPPPVVAPRGTTGTTPAHQPAAAAGTAPATPADRFGSTSKLVTQLTGRDAIRSPGQLSSNLKGVVDPEALPDRLSADLGIHLPELVSLLSLTRQQKASRLVAFLVPYAARLSELAAAVALPPAQRTQQIGRAHV